MPSKRNKHEATNTMKNKKNNVQSSIVFIFLKLDQICLSVEFPDRRSILYDDFAQTNTEVLC